MIKRPPHLLVTTPESLYLMVTAAKSRERLRRVRAVIVDEIHAVARDKRGAHLALTLSKAGRALRHAAAAHRPLGNAAPHRDHRPAPRRSGGGADWRGRGAGVPRHRSRAIGGRWISPSSCPRRPLEAVASHEQWGEILDKIAGHVAQHRTTLVFVNTRRLAERLAHLLAERVGEDRVGRSSRQPLEGPAAQARVATPRGGPEGPRRDGVARARHRHRARRARLPDRLAEEPRDVPAARRPLGPCARRHAQGPPLPDHARRAGGERGAPARRARGPARPRAAAGGAARHPGPADRGRLRQRAVARRRPLRARPSRRALCRPGPRRLRRRARDARGRHPDGARSARRVAAPRSGESRAARTPRRPHRRHHLGRRHPGDGGLQGGRRSRRHRRRHGERGLGHREHGRRHIPPRQHLVAHPARRGGHRARRRRAGRAALGAVLARRGARAHGRAVRRGVRAARARWRLPASGTTARARWRGSRPSAASTASPPRRSSATSAPRSSPSASCRPRTISCSSASSTRRAGCSS